ncbi:MAG: hypothetical protein QOK23_3508 [Gammaproteobacteria bacterium]|jgi:hypothetical protein|nr:hypothetical protein [Gammaproteobacteria bacterium]MEA3141339.1 hypothetical protein [Gammaproteobacteria bacterium]
MAPKLRCNLPGAFVAHDRGNGTWQLTRAVPRTLAVFLRETERGAARAFGLGPIVEVGIEWRENRALLTFMSGGKVASVEAASAIVHEPLEHLYESLPLVSIDANARRFWRRVFRLVRIPGGRFLLKLMTRSGSH